MKKDIKNIEASVRARLQNEARAEAIIKNRGNDVKNRKESKRNIHGKGCSV